MDLALNNIQRLVYHKTPPTNQQNKKYVNNYVGESDILVIKLSIGKSFHSLS